MAADNTYTPIATQTLGTAAATITFSSIPSTYTDLAITVTGLSVGATTVAARLRMNADSATNYSYTEFNGNGTTVSTSRASAQTVLDNVIVLHPTTQSITLINVMNYSSTATSKTLLSRTNNNAWGTRLYIGLWRSTAAINTLEFSVQGTDTYAAGTTITLYGIKAA
jgi:hypothetical protein